LSVPLNDRCASRPALVIAAHLYESILAHVRRTYPHEACGVVAGPRGTGRAERHIELVNSVRSSVAFDVDPIDLLRVYRDLDARDEDVVVAYHSHPNAPAYPSQTDIAYATSPEAHYVIASVLDREIGEFRSFRIDDGRVTEEHVIVEPPPAGDTS